MGKRKLGCAEETVYLSRENFNIPFGFQFDFDGLDKFTASQIVLGGIAKKYGLRANDIILMVNGQSLKDIGFDEAMKIMKKSYNINLYVRRA